MDKYSQLVEELTLDCSILVYIGFFPLLYTVEKYYS